MKKIWNQNIVEKELKQMVCELGIDYFPSEQQFIDYYGNSGLYRAMERNGGHVYWRNKLGLKKHLTNMKHGESKTKLYYVWVSMKQRCENPNKEHYKHYGGRGIKVCDEWHSYETFRDWAYSNGYKNGLTIERIDVNGNYEPFNCTWIEPKYQHWNLRPRNGVTYIGVRRQHDLYTARVKRNGKEYYIGSYTTPEEASIAREKFIEEHLEEWLS